MQKNIVTWSSMLLCLFSLILSPLLPALAQAQAPNTLSPDVDGDGLLNDLEAVGWYNAAGGPFTTDPFDGDTDDDGLSDGEEQLFGSNPLDPWDPGVYVRYRDNYYTKQYFNATDPDYLAMKEGGNKALLTEAMVARRGTKFLLGGPVGATLTIAGSGLTNLTPYIQKDLYGGGWIIDLPSTGTVGTYMATLTMGATQKTLPIHVILQIPQTTTDIINTTTFTHALTTDDITSFLYDDDATNLRDETAVIWRASYVHTRGYAQAFWTDQFKKYVFVDRVMPYIHGLTSSSSIIDTLADHVDEDARVDYYNYVQTDMATTLATYFDGTGWTQTGTPCQNQSGSITSYLRSAGIAARPFIVDWASTSSDYDHAVMMWNPSTNSWQALRSYRGGESGNDAYKYYPFDRGITSRRSLQSWRNVYNDDRGDILVVANSDWNYEVWEPNPADPNNPYEDIFVDGTVGTRFSPDPHMTSEARDYRWEYYKPFRIYEYSPHINTLMTFIWQGDNWEPDGWPNMGDPYELDGYDDPDENWLVEPIAFSCASWYGGPCPPVYDPLNRPAEPVTDLASSTTYQKTLQKEALLNAPQQRQNILSPVAQVGDIVGDYAFDTDNNGRFETLTIEANVYVATAGDYHVGGLLTIPGVEMRYGGIYADYNYRHLDAGWQTVQISFDATRLTDFDFDQYLKVSRIWLARDVNFDPHTNPTYLVSKQTNYLTSNYQKPQLETRFGAQLGDGYTHRGLDQDRDSTYDHLAIDIPLNITNPGNYTLEGDLYDHAGDFIATATWQGTDSTASLAFNIEKAMPPYTLNNLRLFDARGAIQDSQQHQAYVIKDLAGQVDFGAVTLNLYPTLENGQNRLGDNITPTQVMTYNTIDLNGDNLYDELVVDVEVEVAQADQYKLEAWLQGPDGSLVVHSLSDFTALSTGLQTLSLSFDGRAINGFGKDGDYKLIALKVLGDNGNYDVLDQVDVANLTMNLTADDFAPEASASVIFSDNLESGSNNWSWVSPWTLINKLYPNTSTVWEAKGTQSGLLATINNFNASEYVNLQLTFDSSHNMTTANDFGYVSVNTGGPQWTKVGTYTNSLDHWATESLDLSQFDKSANLSFRFNATAGSNLTWDIDNVSLTGLPGITQVSFTYAPVPVVVSATTTFTASYVSLNTELPITYTWIISGEAPVITTSPVFTYQFPTANDYLVQLIVENPYDSQQTSQLVGSYQPVLQNAFTHYPAVTEINNTVTFTATYAPDNDASLPAQLPVHHVWHFGDGNIMTTTISTTDTNVSTTTHTYLAGGNYTAKLVTTNGYGTAIQNKVIPIKEGITSVTFTPNPTIPIHYQPFDITASISEATASRPIDYTWHFDDGTITTTTTPFINHHFETVGNHTVWLTATNGYGSGLVSYSDIIYVNGLPLTFVEFNFTQNNVLNQNEATFTPVYEPVLATEPVTYTWNFGDGTILETTAASTTHEFPDLGGDPFTYTIAVTATNGYGEIVTDTEQVVIPLDEDGDGLSNVTEIFSSNTDPYNPDTDGDTRSDSEEFLGYLYIETPGIPVYPDHPDYGTVITSNPLQVDTDGDLLTDFDEFIYGTHPNDTDTDDDTLVDSDEPGSASDEDGTEPIDPDTDDDTVRDDIEVGPDPDTPLDTDEDTLIDGLDTDDDNDTLLTIDEDVNGNNDPTDDDTDQNTIPNYRDNDDDGDTLLTVDEDVNGNEDLNDDDTDNDTTPNYLDNNDDGDGALTADEDLNGNGDLTDDDTDGDTIPNYLDADNAPSASDDSYTLDEGDSLTTDVATGIVANDVDVDLDPLTTNLVSGPSNGNLTLNADGSFTYQHDGSETTSDSFSYYVTDTANNDSNTATVAITIQPVNDAPTLIDDTYDGDNSVDEGGSLTINATEGVKANDFDPEGDSFTLSLVDSPAAGDLTFNADGSFTYQHDGGETASDTFTYQASDGQATSSPATVEIVVNPINDAPQGITDLYNLDEGATLETLASDGVLANDLDPENDNLTASLMSQPVNGNLTLNSDGSFTYQHDGSETTSDSFTYQVSDPTEAGNTVTVNLIIKLINEAPQANPDSGYAVDEGDSLTVAAAEGVLANDVDPEGNPNLTVVLVDGPAYATFFHLDEFDGSFTYEHDGSEMPTDTFTYQASDGLNLSEVTTATIEINQINDAPTGVSDSYQVDRGGLLTKAAHEGVLSNDIDPEGAQLVATLNSEPTNGDLTFNADGSFTYQHSGDGDSDGFTYTLSDGEFEDGPIPVNITITEFNAPPIANDDTYAVDEEGTIVISATNGVMANDTDPEGNTMTAIMDDEPTNGTITFSNDGAFTYEHDGSETATDTFTYHLVDSASNISNQAVVTLTINPVNDAPVANSDTYNVEPGGTLTVTVAQGVLANDTDPEGDPLTASLVTTPTSGTVNLPAGTLTFNTDGSFVYQHNGSDVTSDSFTYLANDGALDSEAVQVTITIGEQQAQYGVYLPLLLK